FVRTLKTSKDDVFPFIDAKVKRYFFQETLREYVDLSAMNSLKKFYSETEKILVRRIINRQDRLDATFFSEKGVFKKDLNPFILTTSDFGTFYILALLNSKLFSWMYLNMSSIAGKDDFRQTTLAELRKLPIKRLSDKEDKE